ncbi:unnamed protein product, partial [Heligmosomoides polygyrus]|uniref:OB_NTP_bind domain-containing protein n=1 Tax=Heligmosomoides polygyrus TaxID=6339 RepID=A0A183FNI5_HELPZ
SISAKNGYEIRCSHGRLPLWGTKSAIVPNIVYCSVKLLQIANDECDFGMGLELGQWLFLANHELLDKVAHRLLSMAYSLLRRAEYKKILDLQLAPGVRRRKEVDARKQPAA